MITVRIKQEFRDKDRYSVIYPAGELRAFEDERAKSLVKRGLAEFVQKESSAYPKKGKKNIEE